MPVVKFFARLDLDQICLFLDGHQLELLGVFVSDCAGDLECDISRRNIGTLVSSSSLTLAGCESLKNESKHTRQSALPFGVQRRWTEPGGPGREAGVGGRRLRRPDRSRFHRRIGPFSHGIEAAQHRFPVRRGDFRAVPQPGDPFAGLWLQYAPQGTQSHASVAAV
jgi:hypothetical protein